MNNKKNLQYFENKTMRGLYEDMQTWQEDNQKRLLSTEIMKDGDMDAGAWSCGMVAGLINDIPTCKELIDRIMAQAEEIIQKRLEGIMAAPVG